LDVREVKVKRALSPSGIYSVDFSLNPYVGCQHACTYCYVPYLYPRLLRGRLWGHFVDVKINLPRLLKHEVRRVSQPATVLISSITDPYQPIEAKYRLTRLSLEALIDGGLYAVLLTKSPLLRRDLDLLGRLKRCEVGVTITTLNRHRELEPKAPSPYERLGAIEEAGELGLTTYVFLGPLMPGVAELELKELIKEIKQRRCKRVVVDKFRAHDTRLVDKVAAALGEGADFKRRALSARYYEELRLHLIKLCKDEGVDVDFCF